MASWQVCNEWRHSRCAMNGVMIDGGKNVMTGVH